MNDFTDSEKLPVIMGLTASPVLQPVLNPDSLTK
jgi:hypothetical protein